MSLKQKAVNGLFWSFTDSFAGQGVQFIVGIILARILTPREFGLIGMLTIFIAISQSFIDSGFSQALIRKKDCTETDYSTVFFFNLIVSLVFFLMLFFAAYSIGIFFKEPKLELLLKVLGLGLVLNSFTIIQRTILTKEINFKLQTRVSVIASLASGLIAISMALLGYGVWSLVVLILSRFGLTSLFLWLWARWKPIWKFSIISFKELFSFGSKLLISGLIDNFYQNIYYLIIGKYFSAIELGYYTKADQFHSLPSKNLQGIIGRVSYPVLSKIQNDNNKLKYAYKKIIKYTMYVTFCLMFGLAATSNTFVILLIGEKWKNAIPYLQLLCFSGVFYPISAINLSVLKVKGRSDLFLKYVIIVRIISIIPIFIGIFYGIINMLISHIFISFIAYTLNIYYVNKLINYKRKEQLNDLLPSLIVSIIMFALLYLFDLFIYYNLLLKFLSELLIGLSIIILFSKIFRLNEYIEIKEIITKEIHTSIIKLIKNG